MISQFDEKEESIYSSYFDEKIKSNLKLEIDPFN